MNVTEYISSGILEAFVVGELSDSEELEVLKFAKLHPEIRSEIEEIERVQEKIAVQIAVTPPEHIWSDLLAKVKVDKVPLPLGKDSRIEDYQEWLDKVKKPAEFENLHMEVIHEDKKNTTVIAWIKKGEEDHVHESYTEKFLIVEGSCDAIIGGVSKSYQKGDYVEFPIHVNHSYYITSDIPMKVVACLAHAS